MDRSPDQDPQSAPASPQREPSRPSRASPPARVAMVLVPLLLAAYWGPRRSPPAPPAPLAPSQPVRAPAAPVLPDSKPDLPVQTRALKAAAAPAKAPPEAKETPPSSLDFVKTDHSEPAASEPEPPAPSSPPGPSAADEIEAKAEQAVNGVPLKDRRAFQPFVFGASLQINAGQATGAYYASAAAAAPKCATCGNFRRVTPEQLFRSCHHAYMGTRGGRAYVCSARKECCDNYMGTIGGGSCSLVP